MAILLWSGVFYAVQGPLQSNFDRSSHRSFVATKSALSRMQEERSARMRQACSLVMQIPELRALIAEHSYELQAGYSSSLEERLDHLTEVVDAGFVCALGPDAMLIAGSRLTPWRDGVAFGEYVGAFGPARRMIEQVFGLTPSGTPHCINSSPRR
jgi:hypothetical protein